MLVLLCREILLYRYTRRFIQKMVNKHSKNRWKQITDLVERIMQVTSGLSLTFNDQWSQLQIVSLHLSNSRLNSIRLLLKAGDIESSEILTRSMFELSATFTYISKDVKQRLTEYFKHGNIPSNANEMLKVKDELQKLGQEYDNGNIPNVMDVIPTKPWKSMYKICKDLGRDWIDEYNSFYRFASVPTHYGAFTLGSSFIRLLPNRPSTERELSTVLITAVVFHLRVAKIVANNFLKIISLEKINQLEDECNNLGQSLK